MVALHVGNQSVISLRNTALGLGGPTFLAVTSWRLNVTLKGLLVASGIYGWYRDSAHPWMERIKPLADVYMGFLRVYRIGMGRFLTFILRLFGWSCHCQYLVWSTFYP